MLYWAKAAVCTHDTDVWDRLYTVLYLGRAPRTKETLPDFREKMSGHPTFMSIPLVDG